MARRTDRLGTPGEAFGDVRRKMAALPAVAESSVERLEHTLGQWLASHRYATSMIDTSDALSTDLRHICQASGVGAVLWAPKIPVVGIPSELRRLGLDPLDLALNGGEDYELLFTVPKKLANYLPHNLGGVPITAIGEIARGRRAFLIDANGKSKPLTPKGRDPFRRTR